MHHATTTAKPIGIILISAGLFLLLSRFVGFDLLFGHISWPIYIIVPGVVILAIASFDKTVGKALAPLGMMITLTGCLLAYQSWADHYQSWAYAWILTGPFSVGAGLVVHGILHDDKSSIENGRKMAALSLAAFIVSAAVFELVFNISGLGLSVDLPWGILLPAALVAVGGLILLRQPNQVVSAPNPATSNSDS